MASKFVEILATTTTLKTNFVAWYKANYESKLSSNIFYTLPFEYQLGIIIMFIEDEYNYGIHADQESYVIFYPNIEQAKDRIERKTGVLLDKDNIEIYSNSIMNKIIYNYEIAILKVIDLIVNPF
jgi:hypothetical protein